MSCAGTAAVQGAPGQHEGVRRRPEQEKASTLPVWSSQLRGGILPRRCCTAMRLHARAQPRQLLLTALLRRTTCTCMPRSCQPQHVEAALAATDTTGQPPAPKAHLRPLLVCCLRHHLGELEGRDVHASCWPRHQRLALGGRPGLRRRVSRHLLAVLRALVAAVVAAARWRAAGRRAAAAGR